MNKQDIQNFKKSIFSIATGFFITFLILLVLKEDVKSIYYALLIKPWINPILFKEGVILSLTLAVVSLGMAFSLKGSLFNLGIPGQMLASAMATTLVALEFFPNGFSGGWILLLVIGMIAGGLFGSIAGILKAKFHIHEVVSTIMLNWIMFYWGKHVFNSAKYKLTGFPGSKYIHSSLQTPTWALVIITLFIVVFIWFIFDKTTLGYKVTMVGKQPEVAKYAGVNTRRTQIATLAISGCIAGLAGVFYYGTYMGQYTIPLFDGLDSIGFDAIMVSLVAFTNPVAILIVAFIFGFLEIGGYAAAIHFSFTTQLMALNMGITMYCVAASNAFSKLNFMKRRGK